MQYSRLSVHPRRRRTRWRRTLLAVWRDSVALWREFRVSILLLMLVTLGGGMLYGELHALSGRPPLALLDRPYIMFQLMILESPYEAPAEWYLIIFWYVLPLIFIFIVGRGAADFVRLFFDRSQRRDAWREAVASTYNNHVIVFGAGHVGLRVVDILHELDIDVVVIDNSPDMHAEEILTGLHIPLIRADGRSSATLDKAGLRRASAFVACTGDDHTNLDAIMRARDMNPSIRIVARVWDDQFAAQIKHFMNVQSVLSSSGIAAPAFAGLALGVDLTLPLEIGGGSYSTMRLTVNKGSFLAGNAIGNLQSSLGVDIVLHGNSRDTDVQPSREQIVNEGDVLVIFAEHQRLLDIATRNHRPGSGR